MLRRDLIAAGMKDKHIYRMLREGTWVRVRHGAYVVASAWRDTDDAGRHEITARCVVAQAKADVVLSHLSGGTVWDLPFWDQQFGPVDTTRLDQRSGRAEAGVRQHRGVLLPEDITIRYDLPVVSATRLALELPLVVDLEHSLSYVNVLLQRRHTTIAKLRARQAAMNCWPFSLNTDLMLSLADPLCESIGESRTFHLIWRQHLPKPLLQYKVRDHEGNVVARVDFAWPERGVYLEFDGKVKYTRLLKEGESVTDAVLREKRREELINELTGWRCIRITWADLYQPEQTAIRIRRVLFPARAA